MNADNHCSNIPCSVKRNEVINLMKCLALCIRQKTEEEPQDWGALTGYIQQRRIIDKVFKAGVYDISTIILRLTVIDSLYSTNAAYSYFAIDELAEDIFKIGSETKAADYFYSIACGTKDCLGLFSKHYGIRKNLDMGNRQTSLLSKYAFFTLLQDPASYPLGFPIYDSLVCNVYSRACEVVCIKPATKIKDSIENYVAALDKLRVTLFGGCHLFKGFQQFDILDAYLWRIGKIDSGNFSLLLNRVDYGTFITNIGLQNSKLKSEDFDKKVREICKAKGESVLNKISVTCLADLVEHWRKYYQ